MTRHSRSGRRSEILAVFTVLALVMLIAAVAAGCGSSTSGTSITTMTTSAPLTTIVTQGSGANALGPGAKFTIHNGVLSPTELSVPVGGAVTWVNADDDTTRTYEFVATDGSFDTGPLGESDTFSVTFQKAGTYTFTEKNDPTIKGTIVVQ
jgi:plastocyanin